jgi:Dyp-type peroxidase family
MRNELVIKTRSLGGVSDLTLLAPIKQGLIPSLESATYKTRVQRLLRTLNSLRSSSHEYVLLRAFSDAVERVGKINSVRVAIVEPDDRVLLAVTFDGAWQSYIRVLWQKVGALLDVIFCNTEDYVSAVDHTFEEWLEWANRVQIETSFFYGMPEATVDDIRYWRQAEAEYRRAPGDPNRDLQAVRRSLKTVEEIAADNDPFRVVQVGRQGMQALVGLFRLTELYVPNSDDGEFLFRAARNLLLEFVNLKEQTHQLDDMLALQTPRFGRQLDWLFRPGPVRRVPSLPMQVPAYDAGDVQGGILKPYSPVTHGCLVLISFASPTAASQLLRALLPRVTRSDTDADDIAHGQVVLNLAFTCEGLRAVGLTETQLQFFPQEFREGMEARASVLGDLRTNHPRRWSAPLRNWPPGRDTQERVQLPAVHLVVQMRTLKPEVAKGFAVSADYLFLQEIQALERVAGVQVLAVEPLRRYANAAGDAQEHFGFADGHSDPTLEPKPPEHVYDNQVHLGELLLGYDNAADFAVDETTVTDPAMRERLGWLKNGTFLVVRKLAQDVAGLHAALDEPAAQLGVTREALMGRMMGRSQNGQPLIESQHGTNDFHYGFDGKGEKCPFQAHIRRANPRRKPDAAKELPGARPPRLARRGMSYGPQFDPNEPEAGDSPSRGLMFMAYNASISEQFEVVQRWLSGGNSTGISSAQSDPFVGVAPNGQRKHFSFEFDGKMCSVPLDGVDSTQQEPKPFVRLEWGAYLFTPSISTLGRIERVASTAASAAPLWSEELGWQKIEELQQVEREYGSARALDAWKAALEDPLAHDRFVSASIWAAIRTRCNGALRTPYGLLVADRALVNQVLEDHGGNYSACGYRPRLQASIGEIYLGLDRGPGYDALSHATNAAIQKVTIDQAFERARTLAAETIEEFIEESKTLANGEPRFELTLDIKELSDKVLARLCQEWFGMPQAGGELVPGAVHWNWRSPEPPFYPGHFTAPSRFIFQPNPGPTAHEKGCSHGQALTSAMRDFVARNRASGPKSPSGNPAAIAADIFAAFPDATQDDLVARTMVGVMMGFLPTVDGNLRLTLDEWLRDATFWRLRVAATGNNHYKSFAVAKAVLLPPLMASMQLRPSPELIWRTAVREHQFGPGPDPITVRAEERIVVSLVSATQQALAAGQRDVFPIFGGERDPQRADHPTHACPGYAAAMGVLLGTVSALLGNTYEMRPSAAPLTVIFEGDAT